MSELPDTESVVDGDTQPADDERWPIGFMLTIAMVGIYLAYRLVQGVVLFVQWLL